MMTKICQKSQRKVVICDTFRLKRMCMCNFHKKKSRGPTSVTDERTDGPMGTDARGLPTLRCAGTTTRSGAGAHAPSALTEPSAAAQATPPPPPHALPAPPALGSQGGGAAPRAQSLATGGGGGVPFKGRRSSKSRRNSAKHVAKAPESRSESLKRTWDYLARMDEDGVTDALFGKGVEIIPLRDLKEKEAKKRFEINDLYQVVCTRAQARMKQYGVLKDGAPSDEPDGHRCKCGARMVVSLSDAVQYGVVETSSGTSPYFTSPEASAEDAARRGWRRMLPKHHHAPAAKVAANASAAVENVHREDDVEGCFGEYLPAFSRETLVAAVQDGFMNPATRAQYAKRGCGLWRGGKRLGGKPGSRARRRRRSESVSTPC